MSIWNWLFLGLGVAVVAAGFWYARRPNVGKDGKKPPTGAGSGGGDEPRGGGPQAEM